MRRAPLLAAALATIAVLIAGLLALLFPRSGASAALLSLLPPGNTPEELAPRHACPGGALASDVLVEVGVERGREAKLFVSAECPATPGPVPRRTLGVVSFERGGRDWEFTAGTYKTGLPTLGGLAEYVPGWHVGGDTGDYAYVHGRVLSPSIVGAVEALFDNGETLRDEAANGTFALFAEDAAGACEIRLLGKDGRILERSGLVPARYKPRSEYATDEEGRFSMYGVSGASPERCARFNR